MTLEPVKTKWPVSYYEGAVEGAEEEAGRLVEYAASVASRIGQFRVAVGDIAARDAEITRLRAEVERLTARAEKAEREREEATSMARFWEQANADAVRVVHRNAVVLTEARARIRDLEAALRETYDALERLDAIYASEHDPDPVLGTVLRPAWLADALRHARTLLTPTAPEGCQRCDGSGTEVAQYPDGSADVDPCTECNPTPAQPRCQCQWEAGDSPCCVHGEEEGTAPEGGERVTMTIDVDALNAAPAVQCIRCNAPCSECATPTQEGGGE